MLTSVPLYKLQIVDADNERVAVFHGGGVIERHLVMAIAEATAARLPAWRSKRAMQAAVARTVQAVIDGMKADVTAGLGRA